MVGRSKGVQVSHAGAGLGSGPFPPPAADRRALCSLVPHASGLLGDRARHGGVPRLRSARRRLQHRAGLERGGFGGLLRRRSRRGCPQRPCRQPTAAAEIDGRDAAMLCTWPCTWPCTAFEEQPGLAALHSPTTLLTSPCAAASCAMLRPPGTATEGAAAAPPTASGWICRQGSHGFQQHDRSPGLPLPPSPRRSSPSALSHRRSIPNAPATAPAPSTHPLLLLGRARAVTAGPLLRPALRLALLLLPLLARRLLAALCLWLGGLQRGGAQSG